jgi:chaperonin GroEL
MPKNYSYVGSELKPSPEMEEFNAALPEHRQPVWRTHRKPAVVSQPQTYRSILQGVNLIARAVRPTLGPLPRIVALEGLKRTDPVEFLDDGATIARRIRRIEPRGADVGAMMLRHAMWRMHEEVGDGSTTMAIIYQLILSEGIRYVTEFDANAMLLRNGLERGVKAVLEDLRKNAIALKDRRLIANLARGMVQGDNELGDMLAEIFDIVGADGLIEVEGWGRRHLDREYIEGTYWKLTGYYSREFVSNPNPPLDQEVFEDSALLITDMNFTEPAQLVPVLEKCVKAGVKKLVIIASGCADRVIGLLVSNKKAKTIEVMAVRTPRLEDSDRADAMEDLSVLTGGRIFYKATGNTLDDFKVEDLGWARRAWAAESIFGIYGGKGDPRRIRQHIAEVKEKLRNVEKSDEHNKREVQSRLGRLVGGTAILHIGGTFENEITARKEVASRAVNSLRHALRGGVIPGGGSALYHASRVLDDLPAEHEDIKLAYQILGRALEEPMRTIARNAGYNPDIILDRVQSAPAGHGFNAITGKIVDMKSYQILDALTVIERALETAVSGASMALTTDVIIHHSRPDENPAHP